MTTTTLAFSEPLRAELQSWLDDPNEVAGVLIARLVDDDRGVTLLARRLDRAPADTYLDRRPDRLSLRSTGWVPSVRAAADDGSVALFVHTHPGGPRAFSIHDDTVDDELHQAFMDLTGLPLYGALVLSGGHDRGLAGRLRRRTGPPLPIDTFRTVGDRLTIQIAHDDLGSNEIHDRQIRALGTAGQNILNSLRAGVVGAGGTGSPVLEQLTRLGLGHLVIIDDDTVTPSTVARGYGTTTADIGRPKVDVAADHIHRIGLGTTVKPVNGNLRERNVIATLDHCDIVFCCVDGHAPRILLNRWAYWQLAPVIDLAVLASSSHGTIDSIDARVTWLSPGAACLLCRGRIDPRLAHVEQLDPEERRRLAQQGYAPGLDEPEPSIVTYTSLVAAHATTELLNRLFGFATPEPTETLLQLHERAIRHNRRPARPGCFCADPTRWGQGTRDPYLDLTWTA